MGKRIKELPRARASPQAVTPLTLLRYTFGSYHDDDVVEDSENDEEGNSKFQTAGNLNQEEERPRSHLKRAQRVIPHHPPPQNLSERYSELMAKEGPEVMIGDGPEGDRSNRMAKQARRNRALSKRKQSA
ncbi:unnamed protein product [Microthlaspi erraticum]|uniref:Uncharacterized protein n=1 Tax=Microthlaspi erraticum TaxID=1685480 RepID=A0A6D2JZL3_9BRAS|nr:unnamed protein product [Microthlaspi erraticum]